MGAFALGLVAGLIVGWNFLPQPQWVKTLVAKVKDRFADDDDFSF